MSVGNSDSELKRSKSFFNSVLYGSFTCDQIARSVCSIHFKWRSKRSCSKLAT